MCTCVGAVRFGAGTDEGGYLGGWTPWREAAIAAFACTADIFGDPNSGTNKICECADGVGLIADATAEGRTLLTSCAREGGRCR